MCQVRKFKRDQFHKKVYDMLTADCIPIGPPMSTVPLHDPTICGLNNDDEVNDSNTDTLPVATPPPPHPTPHPPPPTPPTPHPPPTGPKWMAWTVGTVVHLTFLPINLPQFGPSLAAPPHLLLIDLSHR